MAENVTARNCMSLPPGRHGIDRGFHLRVLASVHRYWMLRYTLNGRRCNLNLGAPPAISLAMVRQLADNARQLVAQELDPKPATEDAPSIPTFAAIAAEAIANFQVVRKWKNERHAAQWSSMIETYANPFFSSKPVDAVTRDDVLFALLPIWESKNETASRLRGRIEAICEYARAKGFLGATWGEIDMAERVWSIPAERMKCGLPHRVPLSAQATAILEAVKPEACSPSALVFLSPLDGRSRMSIDTPRKTLRDITSGDYTMHGCRSTFRDWCEENFIRASPAERALTHVPDSKVVRAYQRSDLLEQRRPVMQRWTDEILPMDLRDVAPKNLK